MNDRLQSIDRPQKGSYAENDEDNALAVMLWLGRMATGADGEGDLGGTILIKFLSFWDTFLRLSGIWDKLAYFDDGF